jgi:hypothetical protein
VPVIYSGVRFRSTLEGDWAATLDSLDIEWQYEPEAVQLPSGCLYRPDFYLPRIATWLEVKGPTGDRLAKTRELAEVVTHPPGCVGGDCDGSCDAWWDPYQLVVVGLASVRGAVTSYLLDLSAHDDYLENSEALVRCADCDAWYWCGSGAYGCRACNRGGSGDHHLHRSDYSEPVFARCSERVDLCPFAKFLKIL